VRRRPWVAISAALFLGLLLAGIAVATWLFPSKSFSVPRVAIDAQLETDGSMQVVEHLTYDFTGSFTFGTRPIPVGAYQISDMSVSEHGRPLTSVGAPYNLQWFFDATDEQRTFDIAYTVRGVTVVAPDVVELYWKWVGDAHPTIGRVNVVLRVPAGPGHVRAWGHGPLDGIVRVGPDTVRFDARSVPLGTFVEGRVATPAARFPDLTPTTAIPRLPTILTEEQQWAASANRARAEVAASARRESDTRETLAWVAPLIAALGALIFLLAWLRWGREPRAPQDIGKYFRDLPDDPPAVVDALMHWGKIRPNAFGATTLDLARRGYFTITQIKVDRGILPDRTDYVFERAKHQPTTVTTYDEATDEIEELPEGTLRGFEKATLDQIFAIGSRQVTQTDLIKHAKEHQPESLGRWATFESSTERSLRARGYLRAKRSLPNFVNITTAIVVAAVAVAALVFHAWIAGAIALAWAAIQLALTPLLRQRTPKGSRRYHEWLGVRNYLSDFSQLADAPAGHLVLWEKYLVYAVALGVSDELARGLEAHIPVEQTAQFAAWYVTQNGHSYGSLGHFSTSFANSAVSASTPPSSGGGSGGGFSGGGGGGGGGGGIGAG
jgi:uncharacterized membrane protein